MDAPAPRAVPAGGGTAGGQPAGDPRARPGLRRRATALVALSLALAAGGCETTGQGAAVGGAIGATVGGVICQAAGGSTGACLAAAGGGAILGAFIGDQIEREQQKRVAYLAARSGRTARSGTFKNSNKRSVSYSARVTKTFKKSSDPALACRTLVVSKTEQGKAAGEQSETVCQARVDGKPQWVPPEA